MPLNPGQVIHARYRVAKLLAQGGMGAVYRAWDLTFNHAIALKEMLPDPYMPPGQLAQLRQQFRQEAQVLATLSHPSLPRVTDFFEWNGNVYLVMDFIEGESLADVLSRHGPLPEQQVLEWATQLLDALRACHQRNILHRDIKPQNIIIRPDGRAVLVDFGLVKLWDPSKPQTQKIIQQMGTREYAPPEQFGLRKGLHTEPRSDIYSLAATLYHALVGREPPSAIERLTQQTYIASPTQLGAQVRPHVESALLRALALEPQKRFDDANTMQLALAGKAFQHYERRVAQPSWKTGHNRANSSTRTASAASSHGLSRKRLIAPQSVLDKQWPLELGTAVVMAIVTALAMHFVLWGNAPLDHLLKLCLGSSVMGGIGWFIGDLVYQAIRQTRSNNVVSASGPRPTQRLALSTRKLINNLSVTQRIGLLIIIAVITVVGAWVLGPLAYQIHWIWFYVPSYALAGPLAYAMTGRRPGWTFIVNVLVILIGGPVLKASVGEGGDFVDYLLGAVIGGGVMELVALFYEKVILKHEIVS
jgi:serine/threonine-protein kinase